MSNVYLVAYSGQFFAGCCTG